MRATGSLNRRLLRTYYANSNKHCRFLTRRPSYRAILAASVSVYLGLFDTLPPNLRAEVRLVDRDYFARFFPSDEQANLG